MKISFIRLITIIGFITVMFTSAYSQDAVPVEKLHKVHPVEANLKWISTKLKLNNTQSASIKEILSNDFESMNNDRLIYADMIDFSYEKALAGRAVKRWENTSAEIEKILNAQQKNDFTNVKNLFDARNQRIFSLSTRLLLTLEQVEKLEAVFMEMMPPRKGRNTNDFRQHGENNLQDDNNRPDFKNAPDHNNPDKKGMQSEFSNRKPNMMQFNPEKMKEMEKKIESVLTKEQAKLYKQYNEALRKSMPERGKGQFKDRGPRPPQD